MNNYIDLPVEGGGGGSGVSSLNGLTGSLTLVAGTGISITPGVSTLTIAATSPGTVSSVGLSLPSSVFSVSGSPVTTTGTLTGAFTLQTANTVFAGPTSGGAATPTFRALTTADLPAGTGTVTSVTAALPVTSSGGATPNIALNYGGTSTDTLFLNASNNLAVQYMTVSTSESNYFWGYASGLNATGSSFGNMGWGTNALLALTSGVYNIAIGDLSGEALTTGSNNIAIGGSTTLTTATTSSNNIALGRGALHGTDANDNIGIGYQSLFYNTTGTNNTAVGFQAGFSPSGLITSTNITLLGTGTGNSGADGITNSTAIGAGAHVNASNQIVLGNTSVTSVQTGTPSVLYNSASPMTTLGDMEYYSSGVQRLGIGTTGQLLTVVGGAPAWQTLSASSISGVITVPNGGTGNSSFSPYSVITGGATSTANLQSVSGTGTAGQVLMSNGGGILPTWQTPSITNGNPSGSQFITSGTTFTTPSTVNAATWFKFTLIGGGGGGAGTAATNSAAVGGGGGAVGIVTLNGLAASTVYNIAIGAAGSGGAAGANAGSNGGNTTVTIGSTTYTAGFGSGATTGVSNDGAAGGACLNTTISISGGTGGSVGVAGTSTISGYGGAASGYGCQTSGRITTGAGASGTGYGAGGAGGKCSTATAVAGGNGAQGAIFVEWFN
jgi:hypothetical protein